MKKLKLFESFDQLYNQVTNDRFRNSIRNRGIDTLTNGDFNKIADMVEPIYDASGLKRLENTLQVFFTVQNPSRGITIVKGDDEWFYVMEFPTIGVSDRKFYECDGFDGLEKCLNDL